MDTSIKASRNKLQKTTSSNHLRKELVLKLEGEAQTDIDGTEEQIDKSET